jgi:hypothetical protein
VFARPPRALPRSAFVVDKFGTRQSLPTVKKIHFRRRLVFNLCVQLASRMKAIHFPRRVSWFGRRAAALF